MSFFKRNLFTNIALFIILGELFVSLLTLGLCFLCNNDVLREFVIESGGIVHAFAAIIMALDVFLLVFVPFLFIAASGTSVVFQIIAMKKGESKAKNILLMLLAIALTAAMILSWDAWYSLTPSV